MTVVPSRAHFIARAGAHSFPEQRIHGHSLSRDHGRILSADAAARRDVRQTARPIVNWLYTTGGVLSALLLMYLVFALLKPEKFS